MEMLSHNICFNGEQLRFKHQAKTTQCDMHFSIFLPPKAVNKEPCPVLYWLSGLTCTDENFVQKAGAQRAAAANNIIIVCPDTSPRGDQAADDPEQDWDFGKGAGFYVNATQAPWSHHYRMYDYVTLELPNIVDKNFPTIPNKISISGHSMGGHGALVSALREVGRYQSASAFAPIANPTQCPWGKKAFSHYLGNNVADWQEYDTCLLLSKSKDPCPILIDQGLSDNFLDEQLKLDALEATIAEKNLQNSVEVRKHGGYDHSYFFIASYIDDHINFHAKHLKND